MSLDPVKFFKACNPNKTLVLSDAADRSYYIDFTKARSGKRASVSLIDELYRTITRSDNRSHQLFTGHIGCGKSTELRKLQYSPTPSTLMIAASGYPERWYALEAWAR